ncbi:MAG: Rha family transcriptional regulator, partial [Magnetococcales bacterium]|nr:Rha family transcriptional regulator [Magnetococcales bacterium]
MGQTQINPEVQLVDGRLVTTSLEVAGHFGKRHDNVLRDIERIQKHAPEEFNELNFEVISYLDERSREKPCYLITRNGFALLAMGFTGREAMNWKIRFLEIFDRMEQALNEQKSRYYVRIEQTVFEDHPRWVGVRDALNIGLPMESILTATG